MIICYDGTAYSGWQVRCSELMACLLQFVFASASWLCVTLCASYSRATQHTVGSSRALCRMVSGPVQLQGNQQRCNGTEYPSWQMGQY